MEKIGVLPNEEKDIGLSFTRKTTEWIESRGLEALLPAEAGKALGLRGVGAAEFFSSSDMIVVLGGDGTMLRAARQAALYDTPLLGVNLGTMGYLTDAEAGDAFGALESALAGECALEKRMMLECKPLGESFIALNDVCISRGSSPRLVTIQLGINGEYIDTVRADGVIISTPTGSTAYSLSAGGPILKPDSEMIVITFICPHSLHIRPFVAPATDVVSIGVEGACDAVLSMDGESKAATVPGRLMEIRRSKYCATVMRSHKNNFFEVLRHKFISRTI
jgi:NAD+ kinase